MARMIDSGSSPSIVVGPTPSSPSPLFAQAVRENSNLEMDWLWLATQVTALSEQRYCFERALYINPASEPARQGLRQFAARSIPAAPVLARSAGI